MAFGVLTIAHIVLFLFLIIELGLTGYIVAAAEDHYLSHRATYNFMLFNSVWSILVGLYLAITPRVFARAYHSLVALGVIAITMLFWFAGSIALAVRVNDVHCYNSHFCSSAKAATAFGFFIWAIFTGLTVIEGLGARGGGRADKPGGV